MKTAALIVALAIGAGGYYFFLKPSDTPKSDAARAVAQSGASGKVPASAVLNIDPTLASQRSAVTVAPKAVVSADMKLFRERTDLPALYQRIKAGPQSGEAMYLQAEILERCAKRPPAPESKGPPSRRNMKREEFFQTLAGSESQKAAQVAAFDALKADKCGELKNIDHDPEQISRLRKAAADAGDVRARAAQLSSEIYKAMDDEQAGRARPGPSEFALSDAQWDQMRELLATGDVGVIEELRGILSSSLQDASIRYGPDQERIDNRAFMNAWGLAACEQGGNCSADNPQLLSACAFQNRCGSSSVQDHLYFFDSSPNSAQLTERYRQTISEMIRNGNFDKLNLVRGPQDRGNVFMFRNR